MIRGGIDCAPGPKLLIVDHDSEMRQALACFFEKRGFKVAAAATLAEAKSLQYHRSRWTLVISDYHLPDGTGLELLGSMREQWGAATPVLLISGSVDIAALCAGTDYLAKPFPPAVLETRVQTLLGRMRH
jgi:DNA-binding response OmpR family regulator